MIEVNRWYQPDCTLSRWYADDFKCWGLELPWLNNSNDISCIPEGIYEYFVRNSPSHGLCLELRDVEDRTYVQVHSGNYTRQILGCLLVGDGIKYLDNDGIPDVTNSVRTLKKLLKIAGSSGLIEIK